MITEDYCDFETAKLLKEKGFDIPCREHYYQDGGLSPYSTEYNNWNGEENYYSCPTLQMAMKWLREVHHIFVQVELYSKYDDYCFELFQNTHRLILEKHETYNKYEEACYAAIKYCLENLV